MHISASTLRVVRIILIIVLIIIAIIIITSEIDRRRDRRVLCSTNMYYEGGNWITAPFNLITTASVRSKEDLKPYPPLESNFPRHSILQRNWKAIRDEVLDIYAKGEMKQIKNDQFFQKIADDKWKRFYIKWYGPSLADARKKLPFTTKLIDSLPELRSAMISVLEPGSRITPHIGPYRNCLRYHLGLVTPTDNENCWIKVDGIKYSWNAGEDVLFDDTYVHEVHNNTKGLRIVLFCDLQRDLNNGLSNLIGDFSAQIAKVTTRNNK